MDATVIQQDLSRSHYRSDEALRNYLGIRVVASVTFDHPALIFRGAIHCPGSADGAPHCGGGPGILRSQFLPGSSDHQPSAAHSLPGSRMPPRPYGPYPLRTD